MVYHQTHRILRSVDHLRLRGDIRTIEVVGVEFGIEEAIGRADCQPIGGQPDSLHFNTLVSGFRSISDKCAGLGVGQSALRSVCHNELLLVGVLRHEARDIQL